MTGRPSTCVVAVALALGLTPTERPKQPPPIAASPRGPRIERCSIGAVDSSELAALVPGIMASLPSCDWSFGSSERHPHDVIIHISLGSDPLRSATVRVAAGLELFFLEFQGFEDTDFAYDDDDRGEVLKDRLSQAVCAVRGPTRVILERDGEKVVSCRLILLGEGGDSTDAPLSTSWPFRRLAARLRFLRLVTTAIEVTACG